MIKKLLLSTLAFCSITLATQAQTLNIDLNGVTEVNLQGQTGNAAEEATPIIVTLTEDTATGTFANHTNPNNGAAALVFLNLYAPNATQINNNEFLVFSSNLLIGNATTSVDGSNTVYTWEVNSFNPRNPTQIANGQGTAATEANDYLMHVRAFNNNSGFFDTVPTEGSALLLNVVDKTLSTQDFSVNKDNITVSYDQGTADVVVSGDIKTELYTILNITGAVVKQVAAESNRINVAELANGVYILVTDAGLSKFVKF